MKICLLLGFFAEITVIKICFVLCHHWCAVVWWATPSSLGFHAHPPQNAPSFPSISPTAPSKHTSASPLNSEVFPVTVLKCFLFSLSYSHCLVPFIPKFQLLYLSQWWSGWRAPELQTCRPKCPMDSSTWMASQLSRSTNLSMKLS